MNIKHNNTLSVWQITHMNVELVDMWLLQEYCRCLFIFSKLWAKVSHKVQTLKR